MIPEKIVLEKNLVVPLAFALCLSLPAGARAQVVRLVPISGGADAASVAGAVSMGSQSIIAAPLSMSPLGPAFADGGLSSARVAPAAQPAALAVPADAAPLAASQARAPLMPTNKARKAGEKGFRGGLSRLAAAFRPAYVSSKGDSDTPPPAEAFDRMFDGGASGRYGSGDQNTPPPDEFQGGRP